MNIVALIISVIGLVLTWTGATFALALYISNKFAESKAFITKTIVEHEAHDVERFGEIAIKLAALGIKLDKCGKDIARYDD